MESRLTFWCVCWEVMLLSYWVYFAYGERVNLLKVVGVGRSSDQKSTPYVQVKKSYNPK